MLRVALRALRSRRTQSVTLVLLAALVTAAAVAAPFYVYAAVDRLTVNEVTSATAAERQVTVSQRLSIKVWGLSGLGTDLQALPKALPLPDFTSVRSARVTGTIGPQGAPTQTILAQRDGVCAHVVVAGQCPSQPGDVMISTAAAALTGSAIGGTIRFAADSMDKAITLHIVGTYVPTDAADPYWGQMSLASIAAAHVTTGLPLTDAVFATLATVASTQSIDGVIDDDMILSTHAISVHTALALQRRIVDAEGALPRQGLQVESQVPELMKQIIDDTNTIFLGVPLGAAQLVLFGWFALFLCLRATAAARRFDVGVLKLRGMARRRLWTLMSEQSALPVLAGAPFGVVAGVLGARWLVGPVQASGDLRLATLTAIVAAVATIIGGLVAALVAERRALATPVVELLRTTPSRRRGWRTDVVDLIVVAIAIAGIVQIRNTGGTTGSGLAVLAPGLVALAAGLVAARLLMPIAARSVALTRRSGRVRALLTSTYLARRPGLDRIFALLAISVALGGYAILAWTTSAQARSDRAALEIGPARVLTVAPVPAADLIDAVRAADPSGRYAMAATQIPGHVGSASVLAVDSTRLARVLPSAPGLDRDGAAIAAAIRPQPVRAVPVTGTSLQLNLSASGLPGTGDAYVLAVLSTTKGTVLAPFGPLRAGVRVYTAATPTCASAPGCTLSGFRMSTGLDATGASTGIPDPGTTAVLRDLRQQAPVADVVATATFADMGRWSGSLSPGAVGLVLTTSDQGLSMRVTPPAYGTFTTLDPSAYLTTTPLPIPAIVAGTLPPPEQAGVPAANPFGQTDVPIRVVATEPVLPRLEAHGILVDLGYAQALSLLDSHAEASQVWLAAGTPERVVHALAQQGLVTTADDSYARRSAVYAGQASVVALRFQVLGGAIGLLVAALAMLVIASVERDPRAAELLALRRQGVTVTATRAVARRGYLWLAGCGLVAGVIGAILDRYISGAPPSLFSDSWRVLAKPPLVRPYGLVATLVIAGGVLAVATGLSAYQLIRAIRVRGEGSR